MKLFLGGTCNDSTWREDLIKILPVSVDYFNPVVPDWSLAAQAEEIKQKKLCSYHLYVITPKMTGVFSIAEVVDSTHDPRVKTMFVVLQKDGNLGFDERMQKSLDAVKRMVVMNGGLVFSTLYDVALYFSQLNELQSNKQCD